MIGGSMAISKADLSTIAELVGQVVDAKLAAAEPSKPASTSTSKPTSKTNDSPILVRGTEPNEWDAGRSVDGDGWLVMASTSKTRFNNGARVRCYIDGKSPMAATLPRHALDALSVEGVIPAIIEAMDRVDERAHLGQHAVKPAS